MPLLQTYLEPSNWADIPLLELLMLWNLNEIVRCKESKIRPSPFEEPSFVATES